MTSDGTARDFGVLCQNPRQQAPKRRPMAFCVHQLVAIRQFSCPFVPESGMATSRKQIAKKENQ